MCSSHYHKWLRTAENPPKKPNARLLVIEAMPGTSSELVKKTGLHVDSVRKAIKKIHGTEAYIKGWKWVGTSKSPIYTKGNKPDVPCNLQAATRAEYSRRYKERHPERVRLSEAMRKMVRKARRNPQTWFSPLGMP